MLHKHPLENISLAPYGLRSKASWQRLGYKSPWGFWVFIENMSARLWEKRNRASAPRPLPVETILQVIVPTLVPGDFEFEGRPYLTRDLAVLSSAVQWFGTNVGSCFIDYPRRNEEDGLDSPLEFVRKFKHEQERDRKDMYVFLAHFDHGRKVNERDRAVIDGLMHWLGTAHGRQYLADFKARRRQAQADADRRRSRFFEERRKRAA